MLAEAQNTNKGRSKHEIQQLLNAKTRKYRPKSSLNICTFDSPKKRLKLNASLKADKLAVKLRAAKKHLDFFKPFFFVQ